MVRADNPEEVADLTLRVLREIRGEVRQLRDEAKQTNVRLDGLRTGVHGLRDEMHQGFDLPGRRIDHVLLGEHR